MKTKRRVTADFTSGIQSSQGKTQQSRVGEYPIDRQSSGTDLLEPFLAEITAKLTRKEKLWLAAQLERWATELVSSDPLCDPLLIKQSGEFTSKERRECAKEVLRWSMQLHLSDRLARKSKAPAERSAGVALKDYMLLAWGN